MGRFMCYSGHHHRHARRRHHHNCKRKDFEKDMGALGTIWLALCSLTVLLAFAVSVNATECNLKANCGGPDYEVCDGTYGYSIQDLEDTDAMICPTVYKGVNFGIGGSNVTKETIQESCAGCAESCAKSGQENCQIWVFCNNDTGCNNGYGDMSKGGQCHEKSVVNQTALIADLMNEFATTPQPDLSDDTFNDWVSGVCNTAPCCGWSSPATACCSEYNYCPETDQCVATSVSIAENDGRGSDCPTPETCVTKEKDQCDVVNKLCPSDFMCSGVGECKDFSKDPDS